MFKKIVSTAAIIGFSTALVSVAAAQSNFDAKPMNSGPPNMMAATPMAQPASEPAPAEKPMKKHMSKKMKKKMMTEQGAAK